MKHLTITLLTLLVLGGCLSTLDYRPTNPEYVSPVEMEDGYGKQTYSLPYRELTLYDAPSGMVSYEGEFLNNNWNGKGIVTYDNGDWIEADWQSYNSRKPNSEANCYRADEGKFYPIIDPIEEVRTLEWSLSQHYIAVNGEKDICTGIGQGQLRLEKCYRTENEMELARNCVAAKKDTFTFEEFIALPFKIAIGTVLVAAEVADSPAGQLALANEQAKNQRKQEAAAYKKGKRDGIRKAAKRKAAMCQLNRNC